MHQVIAYPGTEGSFTGGAAAAYFPEDRCEAYPTFEEAARAVVEGRADYGLLPVENSFAGTVTQSFALLEKLPLYIVGETARAVRHQLLGLPGASLGEIRVISSHPQAIAQCDQFLAGLKEVQLVPSANTAISAREVAERGDPSCAAIASEEAAERFGLAILARDIQTSSRNTTRFFVISREEKALGHGDKATVVFRVRNRVGALVQVLMSFAISGLNMSHIESRPIPDSPFEYIFVADFEGQMDQQHLARAIEDARPFTQDLRLMGVYPKASRGADA